jgi:hypothetical protein
MRLPATFAAILVVGAAGTAQADADSLVDHLGARETGIGEAMRAGAVGALATRLNPAGLPLTNELVFDGGYGYRPSDSASLVSLAACDSTNAIPGCFYYNYVGSDAMGEGHLRAHTGGFTMAKMINPKIILGSGVKYFDVEVDGMDKGSGVNWDVGATVRLTETLNLAAVGYNLWGAHADQFPRAVGGGVMMHPIPQVTASFDAVWTLDNDADTKTGRYGGGLEYFATAKQGQVGYPIRAGAIHDVGLGGTYLTAGLGFATLKMGVDVGGRFQVAGGDDVAITASLRVFGPRKPM